MLGQGIEERMQTVHLLLENSGFALGIGFKLSTYKDLQLKLKKMRPKLPLMPKSRFLANPEFIFIPPEIKEKEI